MTESILRAFATNERINQYLLEHLSDEAWRAQLPEKKGRNIAEIAAHMHSVRLMWIKAARKDAALPDKFDPATATRRDAMRSFGESHRLLADVLREGLAAGRVKGFTPDAVGFFSYLVAHDAHHRGQIASLAKRLGHPLPKQAEFGMWEWGSRSREVGES